MLDNAALRAVLAKRKGSVEPRLFTPPLRPLTRKTSRGFEVIDFARDVLGEPLTPWQEWVAIHALELNPDGTYRFRIVLLLVARQNGKSHLGKVIKLWKLYMDGCKLMVGAGQDLSLAREMWDLCVETIKGVKDLADELNGEPVRGNNLIELRLTNGARYRLTATNSSKPGRGLSVDHLDFEELREQHDWKAWASLSKTTSARPRPQIWCNSNAGDDTSVVLNQLRESAISETSGTVPDIGSYAGPVNGSDPSVGIFEYSAVDGCELGDPDAICQANPGLGTILSVASVMTSLSTDPPEVFRTEVLCQRVDVLDGAFDMNAWRDCGDPTGSLEPGKDELTLCVDVAIDGQHVTLTGCYVMPGRRVRVEVIDAWPDADTAFWALPGLFKELKPGNVAWFPGAAAGRLAPLFRREPTTRDERREQINYVELTGTKVAEACQLITEMTRARRIVHPNDPLLTAHVAGSKKYDQGDGWRFVRKGAGHVDAAYSAAGAVYTALTFPVKRKPKMMVV